MRKLTSKIIAIYTSLILVLACIAAQPQRHCAVVILTGFEAFDDPAGSYIIAVSVSDNAPQDLLYKPLAQTIAELRDQGYRVRQWGYTTILEK